jgi:hypothetical protein
MTSGCGGGGGKAVFTPAFPVQQYVLLLPSSSSSRRRCTIISCSCESLVCGFSALALLSSAPRPTTTVVPREISVPESADEQLEALELSLLLWLLLLLLEEEEEEAMEEAEVSA